MGLRSLVTGMSLTVLACSTKPQAASETTSSPESTSEEYAYCDTAIVREAATALPSLDSALQIFAKPPSAQLISSIVGNAADSALFIGNNAAPVRAELDFLLREFNRVDSLVPVVPDSIRDSYSLARHGELAQLVDTGSMNPKLSISATKTYQLWIQDSRFRARPRFLYDSLIVARKVAAGDIIATTKQNSIVINPFGTQEQKTARHELVHVAQFSKSVSVLKPNCLQRYFSCDAAIEGAATFLSERELPNNSLPKTFEQFFDASLAQRLSSQALWIARANNSRGRENAFKYTIPAAIIAWRASRSGPENAIKEYMSKPACLYSLERGTSTKLIQ